MRFRSLFIVLGLITVLSFGCSMKTADIKDDGPTEERLVERINDYQSNFIKNNADKMWDITLKSITSANENSKESYIDSLKKSNHMADYYGVKYSIDEIEIKGEKAKIKMTYLVQGTKGARESKATMYDFWVSKNNEWFYAFGGKPALYAPKGWW